MEISDLGSGEQVEGERCPFTHSEPSCPSFCSEGCGSNEPENSSIWSSEASPTRRWWGLSCCLCSQQCLPLTGLGSTRAQLWRTARPREALLGLGVVGLGGDWGGHGTRTPSDQGTHTLRRSQNPWNLHPRGSEYLHPKGITEPMEPTPEGIRVPAPQGDHRSHGTCI